MLLQSKIRKLSLLSGLQVLEKAPFSTWWPAVYLHASSMIGVGGKSQPTLLSLQLVTLFRRLSCPITGKIKQPKYFIVTVLVFMIPEDMFMILQNPTFWNKLQVMLKAWKLWLFLILPFLTQRGEVELGNQSTK